MSGSYRGRIAPTPTGLLHLGHAATFWRAAERARLAGGTLIWRTEDLDPRRCRADFAEAAMDDMRWLGLSWQEGPDVGGSVGPYCQSQRRSAYLDAWRTLRDGGWIYPCSRSRKELSTMAPHEEEPVFPVAWRESTSDAKNWQDPAGINWRFCVPDYEKISFQDGAFGPVAREALKDFGDFLVWNREDVPAYELAVVVDDRDMMVTEVVRGEDLLTSTARQLLLYRALGAEEPDFYHCPLVRDDSGRRLAKRDSARTLQTLRREGWTRERVLAEAGCGG